MIKKLFLLSIAMFSIQCLYAQIGIGTTNPDESSVLDVSSTNKGILFPRITSVQPDAIVNPAVGLTIYNLDESCLQVNSGTSSIKVAGFYWTSSVNGALAHYCSFSLSTVGSITYSTYRGQSS